MGLHYTQLVTPSVVATAVRTDTISWITNFQVSFFIKLPTSPPALNGLYTPSVPPFPGDRNPEGEGASPKGCNAKPLSSKPTSGKEVLFKGSFTRHRF